MAHTALAELLDLDVEVLHDYHHEVIGWVGSLSPDKPLIVDLGAGTGAGSIALARELPHAQVVAVDVDDDMLTHLRRRAEALGLADRIRTVRADLNEPWPELGPADVLWASASLHHVADPAATLARAFAALRPCGVFAVTELDSFPHFLPDGPGAELESRGHEVAAARRAEAGLHMSEDWTARLIEAGFTVEAERRFDIHLRPPLPAAAGRYAQVSLERMQHGLADRLGTEDRAALADLVAGIGTREDLEIRTTRTVWLARRPG